MSSEPEATPPGSSARARAPGRKADAPAGQHPFCDLCGAPMRETHCKLICDRCGYTRDCSDP